MEELLEKNKKAVNLAQRVLLLSRNTLLINLRFLDLALSRLKAIPAGETICSDGNYFYYNPFFVLNVYKKDKDEMTLGYFHVIMHCIFRHMFINSLVDQRLWNLACDIAVEASIASLEANFINADKQREKLRKLEKLNDKIPFLSAEKVYAYLRDENICKNELLELEELFVFDDHAIWYMSEEEKNSSLGLNTANNQSQSKDGDPSSNGSKSGNDPSSDNNSGNETESDKDDYDDYSISATSGFWQNASERLQQEIEHFSNGRYGKTSYLTQNLKEVNREKYDYSSFLKKFAVIGEAMKINDDEFDYIFYTYGLKQYGNMPLIEPLEYKDVKKIKDFVIAIDTSGSVTGDLVQTFVKKTYNIMKSTESFFSKINLHIIQADDEIQEDVLITNQADFDRYLATMELHGFGGNNEVNLFNYIDNLVLNKAFTNLKGMIYLTDGYGIFPKNKPNYEVAFVFIDDRYEVPEVPPWVIKLVLQKDEV